ncbi:MAG: hypothetical protein ACE5JE_00530 [Thermoplasmata archaeon]
MITPRRVTAVILLVLTITGVVLWAQVLGTYIAINDARLHVPDRVGILEVRVPRLPTDNGTATVGVLVRVENPSSIAIRVFSITYWLYMDNLVDTRAFWEKADDIEVGRGGFHDELGGYVVPPHSVRDLWANLTVEQDRDPVAWERLNLSFGGRYYPIVLGGTLQYRFPGLKILGQVRGLSFTTFQGVVPYEG